jgi:hypothetical protein
MAPYFENAPLLRISADARGASDVSPARPHSSRRA